MPATSQQQQKLFGLALSVKRGETPRSEASEDVLNIVDSMTEKEIEDFAGTSHKGLPKKVEEMIRELVRTNLKESFLTEDRIMNKKVKQLLDKKLSDLTKGKPNHQFAVMHILMGALGDANFHSEAKKVPSLFPRAKYEGDPMAAKDVEEYYHYEIGPDVASICKWDGKDIVDAIGFYVSMTIGRPVGEKVEKLVESSITEAGISRMYMVFLGAQKKVKELEDAQKELLAQWKAEKDPKKKANIFDKMKKGTITLKKRRANLSDIERDYIDNMAYDTSYSESVNEAVSKTFKYQTRKGTLHIEIEEDPAGVMVDVIFNKVDLTTTDIQFPVGDVVVTQRKKNVKLKESVNERLTTSDMKYMDGLALKKSLDTGLKELRKVGQDLIDSEGFAKEDVKEFLLSRLSRVLHVGLNEGKTK